MKPEFTDCKVDALAATTPPSAWTRTHDDNNKHLFQKLESAVEAFTVYVLKMKICLILAFLLHFGLLSKFQMLCGSRFATHLIKYMVHHN